MTKTQESASFRVLMLCPFLQLSKKLTQKKFQIYFCSTAINLSFIKKNLGESSSDNLRLVELHLPDVQAQSQWHSSRNFSLTTSYKKVVPQISR